MEKRIPATLSALGRFGNFKPESEQKVRAPTIVRKNPKLERMKQALIVFNDLDYFQSPRDHLDGLHEIESVKCSAKDIQMFSLILPEFLRLDRFSVSAGILLSGWINHSPDMEFTIDTTSLEQQIDCLGFQNRKIITVQGNIGRNAGQEMQQGALIVKGNAGAEAGYRMKGGELFIHGDTEWNAGGLMEGGRLVVCGDARMKAGESMNGGEIIIHGNSGYGSGGYIRGGKLTIHGNAGDRAGYRMQGGAILVKGNIGSEAGSCMVDGNIIVLGNAGDSLGKEMHKGRIIVKGSAGIDIGEWMDGGIIRIKGMIGGISDDFESGKIYHGWRRVAGE
jgi:formylmethanofuran dehydrogenase subunit C